MLINGFLKSTDGYHKIKTLDARHPAQFQFSASYDQKIFQIHILAFNLQQVEMLRNYFWIFIAVGHCTANTTTTSSFLNYSKNVLKSENNFLLLYLRSQFNQFFLETPTVSESSDACCPVKMEYLEDGTPGSLFVLQANVEERIKAGCVMDGCVYIK